ncbi:MAG TPA: tetratricopeptide repeat protein [Bacteroidia bacterium]|nr:tetratricopeptide repeat protein [Bacteroidia bacterium]
MKRLLLYSSFLVLSSSLCSAQNKKSESLRNLLKTEKEDTSRVKTLNNLSWELDNLGFLPSADSCANEALLLSKKLNYKKGEANAYKYLGIIAADQGNYSLALDYDYKSLTLDQQINDRFGVASNFCNIGNIYFSQKDELKALDCYIKALAITKEMKDTVSIANNLCNIGNVYETQGNYSKAIDYYNQSVVLSEKIGFTSSLASNYGNTGDAYYDEANTPGTSKTKMDSLYKLAFTSYTKAMALYKQIDERAGVATGYCNLGAIYVYLKNFSYAKAYLDSALTLSLQMGDKPALAATYRGLIAYDSATNNYKQEAEDYKTYIKYNDSLVNEANTKKTVQAEMSYEFEQQQAKAKAEQDKKDILTEQERKKQALIRNAFIGGFILMLVLAFFIYRGYRQKQKTNAIITGQKKEVEHQKAIAEEKNKDITASIRYASRIQRALLTTDEYIGQHLQEYFILFKPRDIVSGDFYWAFVTDKRFYIACCDCTGHGVPGAFMSLLNISMLNESVVERKITRPDLILNAIRTSVINALNPDGKSETKDGMDCSLAAIDFQNNMLHAACANNPVWIIRDGQCTELKPDKMPVGIQDMEQKPFTLKSFELKKGDCIYLFTDGYADQFGGPKGKKFKYVQLQELLVSNAYKPMKDQKSILDAQFESWKYSLEQVDDVLMIGIRV